MNFYTDVIANFYFTGTISLRLALTGVDVVSWDRCFDRSVVLPDGKTLRTLEDARLYILALPTSDHDDVAWQVAIEALLLAAGVSDADIEDHERHRGGAVDLARDR